MTQAWHLAQMNMATLAFTFKERFPAPDAVVGAELDTGEICVGWE